MSRRINIFVHPGYGKTGTTYLQESVFDKINFVNLGRPHNHKNELINKLILLQYKIFQKKTAFQKFYPMNYSYSVRNYVSILKSIIDKTDNTNFMFSDENLFDCNNYFGYFNIYLLKEILDSLNNYFDINIKFIISIRNQHQYLISSFAYDNYRMKKNFGSFNNFLDKIFSDEDLSEIYQFDLQIKKIKEIFNSEVLILPLEELEKNHENYINRLINFLGIGKEVELNTFNNNPVNKNSELVNNNKVYYTRSYDFRGDLYEHFSNIHMSLKKYKLYQKNFQYLRFLKELIKPVTKKTGEILLNENQKRKIQQHFKQSNQNTEKNNNLNLKFYDYYD